MKVCSMIRPGNKAWECLMKEVDCPECPLFAEALPEVKGELGE